MTKPATPNLSIIIPAKNEAEPLRRLLPALGKLYPDAEIIVVDDGSTDETHEVCRAAGIITVRHPLSLGNGAAIKAGIRSATGDVLVLMDGDGQHNPEDICRLLERLGTSFSMVVGARKASGQANVARGIANGIYNRLASWMVGHKIDDLTSGFRVAHRRKFLRFLHLLPNGFSYPTTITMAFFRAGYPVGFVPIDVQKRKGRSHIRPLQDGARFFLIIFKVASLYSPLKVFAPAGFFTFTLGLLYAIFTLVALGRFTNMSATLLTTGIVIFLIGLVSEQITTLIYGASEE